MVNLSINHTKARSGFLFCVCPWMAPTVRGNRRRRRDRPRSVFLLGMVFLLSMVPPAHATPEILCKAFDVFFTPYFGYISPGCNPFDPTGPRTQQPSALPSVAPSAAPTRLSEFDIELRYRGVPESDKAIFESAAEQWREIIKSDLPEANATALSNQNSVFCDFEVGGTPIGPGTIDDIRICALYVELQSLPGGLEILALTAAIHSRTDPTLFPDNQTKELPYYSEMVFNSRFLGGIEFNDTVFHEMAHAFGYGTRWIEKGLINATRGPGGIIVGGCAYTGSLGVSEWQALSGCTNSDPNPTPPIEQNGLCGHWEESCFMTELMTPLAELVPFRPVARITIATLEDLGYEVDYDAADPFTADDLSPACRCSSRLGLPDSDVNVFKRTEGPPKLVVEAARDFMAKEFGLGATDRVPAAESSQPRSGYITASMRILVTATNQVYKVTVYI